MLIPDTVALFAPMLLGAIMRGRLRSGPIHKAVTDFLFPCLVFSLMMGGVSTAANMLVSASALLISLAVLIPLGILFAKLVRNQTRTAVLPIAFGNSGFLGIPTILVLGGADAALYAVYFDQTMTIAIYSIGLSLVVPGGVRRGMIEVVKAPVFWVFIAALGLSRAGLHPPDAVTVLMEWIGRLTVPAALFSIGLDLDLSGSNMKTAFLPSFLRTAGGAFAAVVTLLLAGFLCTLSATPSSVTATLSDPSFARMVLLQGLMPSAVFSALLPARYGTGGPLAPAIVLTTTVIFPAWLFLLLLLFPWISI